jgi:hypothetical protein
MAVSPARRASVSIGAAVPSLVRWGLSCDADLVFRTLTTFGPRSVSTLAAELGYRRCEWTAHSLSCWRSARRSR